MQKFKLSWIALLKNDEHAQLIEQLCGILDDCPIDNPYVTKAAAKVKSHLPALRCVGSESRKHELTAVLDELDGKTGYAELIGELDRLLVYYRRTVGVRKGRRSAAKERAKSRTAGTNREASGTNGANGANRADKGTSVPNFFGFRL